MVLGRLLPLLLLREHTLSTEDALELNALEARLCERFLRHERLPRLELDDRNGS